MQFGGSPSPPEAALLFYEMRRWVFLVAVAGGWCAYPWPPKWGSFFFFPECGGRFLPLVRPIDLQKATALTLHGSNLCCTQAFFPASLHLLLHCDSNTPGWIQAVEETCVLFNTGNGPEAAPAPMEEPSGSIT